MLRWGVVEKIKESVSVNLIFNHKKRKTSVSKVTWQNRPYKITRQGLHHTYKRGSTVMHVFSVVSDTISFKLILDSSSLIWTLEETYDPNFR